MPVDKTPPSQGPKPASRARKTPAKANGSAAGAGAPAAAKRPAGQKARAAKTPGRGRASAAATAEATPQAAPLQGPNARPFIFWTLRRTGGTNLAQRVFLASPFPTVEHEPFNGDRVFGAVSRLWHGPGTADPGPDQADARRQALTQALARRPLIKHCVELFGDQFNLALVQETVRLGYRHLFLYRRQQDDRLLSLHVAKSTGQWGPRQAPTLAGDDLPPVPALEMVAHARQCNRMLTLAWDALVAAGAEPRMLAFEDIYKETDSARVRDRLDELCRFLLEDCLPPGDDARVALVDKIMPGGGRSERASPHEGLPGVSVMRAEMVWQPGFEPTRERPAASADETQAAIDGVWLSPWSIGYRPVPMAAVSQVQQALYQAGTGHPYADGDGKPGQALEEYLAERRTDIRNARVRFTVVSHPARRFIAAYAHLVLQRQALSKAQLKALAQRQPELARMLGVLTPDPTLAQFVDFYRAYLKVPAVAELFRPIRQVLGSLDRFDRIYAAERLDRLAEDLSSWVGRPVALPPPAPMPRLPASDKHPDTLARIRELCADDFEFLAPLYGPGKG